MLDNNYPSKPFSTEAELFYLIMFGSEKKHQQVWNDDFYCVLDFSIGSGFGFVLEKMRYNLN